MIPLRLAQELTYQLEEAHEDERLARALASIPIFLVLCKGVDRWDMLHDWQRLSKRGIEPEAYYRISLESLPDDSSLIPDALVRLNDFFETRGAYVLSEELLNTLLAWAIEREDLTRELEAHRGLGILDTRSGNFDSALLHLQHSASLAESLGDQLSLSMAYGNMGVIYKHQGRNTEAMEYQSRNHAIAEPIGHKRGVASAKGNMGLIHFTQGRYADAMIGHRHQLAIAESLGDKQLIAGATGNIGLVHMDLGEYADAMSCYERMLALNESLGNTRGVMLAVGSMGIVHIHQGRYAQSMEHFERQFSLSQKLGDRSGMVVSTGNIGFVLTELGKYHEAVVSFNSAIAMSHEFGFRFGLVTWHEGIARALILLAEKGRLHSKEDTDEDCKAILIEARQNAEECLRLSEELGNHESIFKSKVLLARITAEEGNSNIAIEQFENMLKVATESKHITELHFWQWKVNGNDLNRQEALAGYLSLAKHVHLFEYQQRIAELKGQRIPKSADDL